jgi:hypothetical protein
MPSAAYLMQRYYKIFNLDNNAKLVDAKKDKKKEHPFGGCSCLF